MAMLCFFALKEWRMRGRQLSLVSVRACHTPIGLIQVSGADQLSRIHLSMTEESFAMKRRF